MPFLFLQKHSHTQVLPKIGSTCAMKPLYEHLWAEVLSSSNTIINNKIVKYELTLYLRDLCFSP